MLYGYKSDGTRVSAEYANKSDLFFCPGCLSSLVLKQGSIKVWHFAHAKNCSCNLFTENKMTEWHINHQEKFGEDCREVRLAKDGKVHIADIKDGNAIVEYQHSPISNVEFEERSKFYSEFGHLIWVFDFIDKFMSDAPTIHPSYNKGKNILFLDNPNKILSQYDFCVQPIVDVFLELQEDHYFLIKWSKHGGRMISGEWMNEAEFHEYIQNIKDGNYGTGKKMPLPRCKTRNETFVASLEATMDTQYRIHGIAGLRTKILMDHYESFYGRGFDSEDQKEDFIRKKIDEYLLKIESAAS